MFEGQARERRVLTPVRVALVLAAIVGGIIAFLAR